MRLTVLPERLNLHTRDADDEGEGAQEMSTASFDAAGDSNTPYNEETPGAETDSLEEGMLLRDVPKRTTFYDPVAERQMSQTDAKFFYQRNKPDSRNNTSTWSQMTPSGSPMMSAGSRPPTEHGADSLILDPDAHPSGIQTPFKTPSESRPQTPAQYGGPEPTTSIPRSASMLSASQHGALGHQPGVHDAAIAAQLGQKPPVLGGLFDTEPQITSELSEICQSIQRILDLRRKYIGVSNQGPEDNPRDKAGWEIYPPPPEPAWKDSRDAYAGPEVPGQPKSSPSEEANPKRPSRRRKPGHDIGEDFDLDDLLPLPSEDGLTFEVDESGVYQVFEHPGASEPAVRVPTIREFYMDLEDVLNTSSDGPSKSFAFRRLQYLEGKFNLYALLNEYQETADSKKVPHRDFYNVRKVDTHVHHSACMNQKHLLRFIKSKMKKFPNEVVLYRDGKHLTLAEVFASINLTAYDLSIDTLDMHVSTPRLAQPPSPLPVSSY